jgi:NADH-quinone oxidoreductase subunit A
MAAGGGAQTQGLLPLLVYVGAVVVLLSVTLLGSWIIGPRTKKRLATELPYESGILPVGSAETTRFSIEFYLIAMFFVIFDLETVFIFGWAIAFHGLGWPGYLGAAVFIGALIVALVYELSTGALDYGVRRRAAKAGQYALAPVLPAAPAAAAGGAPAGNPT